MTKRLDENQVLVEPLRHYKRNSITGIIFNRLVHKFNYHFCACRRFVPLDKCYGVINNDCYLCMDCIEIA